MSSIRLVNVSKKFGEDTVIPNLNLTIKDHSFTILVGSSGCGKTTTLRMITGLEMPTKGSIFIGDVDVSELSPGKRDIAMVFQNYALYPTMTVEENIGFGLTNRKMPSQERRKVVAEICEIVGLSDYLKRKPGTLSGGQRQRVALARAMVKKPKVFLMDEPLSNLDAKLRAQMRLELIGLHRRLNATFVYVTHDQVEAMSMGDDIVLMHEGRIVQQSSPRELYRNPNSIYSAQFMGSPSTNVLDTRTSEGMRIGFRPERVQIGHPVAGGLAFKARISTKELLGSEIIYSAETPHGSIMIKSEVEVEDGESIAVAVAREDLFLFDDEGLRVELTDALYYDAACLINMGQGGR